MELTPHGNSAKTSDLSAECRCPPGTAQLLDSLSTSPCYKLFDQGPCDLGQYFAPIQDSTETRTIMYVHFNLNVFYFQFISITSCEFCFVFFLFFSSI